MEKHPDGRRGAESLRKALAVVALAFAGCASAPPIVSTGPGAYLITRQAATAFSGLSDLKVEAVSEAGAHCARLGKTLTVTDTQESRPPYIFGNYPRVEVRFTCT